MKRFYVFTPLIVVLFFAGIELHAQETAPVSEYTEITGNDFPWWRGLTRDGQASPNSNPPMEWDERKNVLWRTPIPGRGHGAATVLGSRVFITAADLDKDEQSVLCLDRDTGKVVWQTAVHTGGLKTKGNKKQNKKASLASTTIATNGRFLFVNFLNDEAAWTSCLSLDGETVWQKKICDYVVHQGYGSSPALYRNLVIVSADNKGKSGGAVVAFKQATGEEVWRHSRPSKPNYSSPAILTAAGKTQVIMIGCDLATSLDPLTGSLNWEVGGATTECVITTVTDGQNIFTSGGYPKNHISAVAADGTSEKVWENGTRAYVPSILYRDNHLYAVLDAGVAVCFRCSDGSEVWKKRLGGTFSSSPMMVNDKIYAVNESGEWFIFSARPDKFELLAENKLGDNVFATPTVCGDEILVRVAINEKGKRQEYLYCLRNDR